MRMVYVLGLHHRAEEPLTTYRVKEHTSANLTTDIIFTSPETARRFDIEFDEKREILCMYDRAFMDVEKYLDYPGYSFMEIMLVHLVDDDTDLKGEYMEVNDATLACLLGENYGIYWVRHKDDEL